MSALLASHGANEGLAIGAGDLKLLRERGPRFPVRPTPHNGLSVVCAPVYGDLICIYWKRDPSAMEIPASSLPQVSLSVIQ